MLLQVPLDIVGEVQAIIAEETVQITASTDTITVDVPSVRVVLLALRSLGRRKQRSNRISRADAALQATWQSVRFRIAGSTVAMLGFAARPGILSRLLGVAPLEIRLSGLLVLLRSWIFTKQSGPPLSR